MSGGLSVPAAQFGVHAILPHFDFCYFRAFTGKFTNVAGLCVPFPDSPEPDDISRNPATQCRKESTGTASRRENFEFCEKMFPADALETVKMADLPKETAPVLPKPFLEKPVQFRR